MASIRVTFEVSKPDTSSVVKLEQPENILSILLVWLVFQELRSRLVKLEQFWNIPVR